MIRNMFPTLDMELNRFETELRKSRAAYEAHGMWQEPDLLSTPMLEMNHQRSELLAQAASDGMSWDLLRLEWRYDLALLLSDFKHWMRYIDEHFNPSNPPEESLRSAEQPEPRREGHAGRA